MSRTRQILREMALDLGGEPDLIDPERRQHIERGTHPYSRNPAFPTEPGQGSWPGNPTHLRPGGQVRSFVELMASDEYKRLAGVIREYIGRMPRSRQEAMAIVMRFMQAAQQAAQIERPHRRQLEQLAIQAVLNHPEFKLAKEVYDEGQLKIDAKLIDQVGMGGAQMAPPEEEEEQIPEIKAEVDAEGHKRRMLNVMTQGAAMSKNYIFKDVSRQLSRISPDLPQLYGTVMGGAELMYWLMSEGMMQGAAGEGEGAAGKTRFEMGEDGIPIIHAEALVFPVLTQEISKGLMLFLSHDTDVDEETYDTVRKKEDTVAGELWDIPMGAPVWRAIMRQIGQDNATDMPHIFNELRSLSPGEFSRITKAILRGDQEGRDWINQTLAKFSGGDEGEAGPGEGGEGGGPTGSEGPVGTPGQPEEPEEEDPGDWWKKESSAKKRVDDLLG